MSSVVAGLESLPPSLTEMNTVQQVQLPSLVL